MELKEILIILKESWCNEIRLNNKLIFDLKYYNLDNLDNLDFIKFRGLKISKTQYKTIYLFNLKNNV